MSPMTRRPEHPRTQFGTKLVAELERQGLSNRQLAKRLSPTDPINMRRSVARWLAPAESAVVPSDASRRAVEEALGIEAGSLSDDEDEDDLMAPLSRALRLIVDRKVDAALARLLAETQP